MKPYRPVQIRCKCLTCVADRWANRFWLCFFVLAGAYIGFQIVRAYVLPVLA